MRVVKLPVANVIPAYALAAVCLLAVLSGCTGSSEDSALSAISSSEAVPTAGGTAASTTPAVPFDESQASALASVLAAGNASAVESVVALPSDVSLSSDVVTALQSLGPVVFDARSFHDNGDDTATVNATAGDIKWIAHLLLIDGRWMLVATTEESGQ